MSYKDGYYTIKETPIYYKLFTASQSTRKLIILHGGPGATHDVDLPLARLSEQGITVLLYDQYGCGRSGETADLPSRLTTEYYVEELESVRRSTFGDEKVYIMGHSWGGMLALAYGVKHQDRIRGLITTGGLSSVPYYIKEANKLIRALPRQIRQAIEKYETAGDYNNPDYLKAVDHFYHKHLCRLDKWPDELYVGLKSVETRKVYKTWWGPNEFRATGALKNWDITDQIRSIKVPTLVTTGRYDEVSPNVAKLIHNNIRGSDLVMFENSSHTPMWEEPEHYLETVKSFINQN